MGRRAWPWWAAAVGVLAVLAPGRAGAADPPCGAVEFRFTPGAAGMQVVVWVEDKGGKYVDTPYITRVTGQFGLGNRPGAALLKTDFGWPYGRREMVAPIWAHRRDHHYPKITMGGACGSSSQGVCPGGGTCGGDCDDTTIVYHSKVSSVEPFYCSPSGASKIDAMSCASRGTFSKGAYLAFPQVYSLYPPRADINAFNANADSPDLLDFPKRNDLAAVSQATPPARMPVSPAPDWFPQNLAEGDYVAWIELSQESDFNASHNHPNQPDSNQNWVFEGHAFLGQPSVVYQAPFHYGPAGGSASATKYAGYSTWDGSDGVMHGPDQTITDAPGSGAGRLLDANDGQGAYRFKVVVGACAVPTDMSTMPPPADLYGVTLDLTGAPESGDLSSTGPASTDLAGGAGSDQGANVGASHNATAIGCGCRAGGRAVASPWGLLVAALGLIARTARRRSAALRAALVVVPFTTR